MPQQPQQSFDAMRQDAIRRSREMQRRAVPSPASEPTPSAPADSPHGRDDAPVQQAPGAAPPEPPPKSPNPQGLLQSLKLPAELNGLLTEWNGEKLALAALLYLLYKEGADVSLLLAIAYILL